MYGNIKIDFDKETGDLIFPILFLYDEFGQSDIIQVLSFHKS